MLNDREQKLLTEGIELFNQGRFWDAHEAWERVWLDAEDPVKRFLQGLIQLAAAFHHFQRGTFPGGIRLVDAAVEKLSGYPSGYLEIDRRDAIRSAIEARERASSDAFGQPSDVVPEASVPHLRLIGNH